jgi:hypothetical protein
MKFGDLVKDAVTGFQGKYTAKTTYLTGPNRLCIEPEAKDGKCEECRWFDEERVVQVV